VVISGSDFFIGEYIAAGFEDGALRVWDAGGEEPARTLEAHSGSVTVLVLVPAGVQAVSVGSDGLVKTWDLESSSLQADPAYGQGVAKALGITI
jgi:WD40 repeat protein